MKTFFAYRWLYRPNTRPFTPEEVEKYKSEGVALNPVLDSIEQEIIDELMEQGRIEEAKAFEVVRSGL